VRFEQVRCLGMSFRGTGGPRDTRPRGGRRRRAGGRRAGGRSRACDGRHEEEPEPASTHSSQRWAAASVAQRARKRGRVKDREGDRKATLRRSWGNDGQPERRIRASRFSWSVPLPRPLVSPLDDARRSPDVRPGMRPDRLTSRAVKRSLRSKIPS
jgi:hypothetical protein